MLFNFNEILKPPELNSVDSSIVKKCLIHVHGFQPYSTKLLHHSIIESMGDSKVISSHQGAPSSNEGHGFQSVYPTFTDRRINPDVCAQDAEGRKKGKLYYCPKALNDVVNKANKITLFKDWSRYWDLNKTFLIQRSPSFDVLLLERLKISPTFHAIVMKHPLLWRGRRIKLVDLPIIWLDTWANTLDLLFRGKIESFAVVNFEILKQETNEITKELSSMITDSCPYYTNQARRLSSHVRSFNPKFNYDVLDLYEKDYWDRCERMKECNDIMNDLTPLMSEFGYTWDRNNFFEPNRIAKGGSYILFSSHNLPSPQLVKQMKEMVDKYIT